LLRVSEDLKVVVMKTVLIVFIAMDLEIASEHIPRRDDEKIQ